MTPQPSLKASRMDDLQRRLAELRHTQRDAEKSRDYYYEGYISIGFLDDALDIAEELVRRLT